MRRISALALILTSALAVTACGGPKGETEHGETEGVQVTAGELQYQVQVSRVLNPAAVEDADLLKGVAADEAELEAGEEWFAVFVQARNDSGEAQQSAATFTIEDTLGTEFEPVEVDSALAYQPTLVPDKGILPALDSASSSFNTNGAMLLFPLTQAALENRPLELIIQDPKDPSKHAAVRLDV